MQGREMKHGLRTAFRQCSRGRPRVAEVALDLFSTRMNRCHVPSREVVECDDIITAVD